jgi:hypothetical protein
MTHIDTDIDTRPNRHWFHIRYTDSAPSGLPPVLQADRIVRYADDDGAWLIALWQRVAEGDAISDCILRVAAANVLSVTQHLDLAEAAHQVIDG